MYMQDNIVGIGFTPAARKRDWQIKKDSTLDNLPMEYRSKFLRFRPWSPVADMLHISYVGCLMYNKPMLTNTANGKSVLVNKYGKSMYYYIMKLYGSALSYEDIVVVLRKQLDSFFTGITKAIAPLSQYETIQLCTDEELNAGVVYEYDTFCLYLSKTQLAIKKPSMEYWYIMDIQDDWRSDLCYMAYYAGIDISPVVDSL